MPAALLAAKLRPPPSRQGLVTRARLLATLDGAWQAGKRLILLSAPAGYGKTTLISDWISGLQENPPLAHAPPLPLQPGQQALQAG